jgi:hypothetical protein
MFAATETGTTTVSGQPSTDKPGSEASDFTTALSVANAFKAQADEETLKGSGKLIERGLSVGAAATAVVHLASGGGRNFDLKPQAAVVAMPYLALYPAYWVSTEPVRKFCASKHSLEEEDARRAADAVARKRAEVYVDQFRTAYAEGGDKALAAALSSAGATSGLALGTAVMETSAPADRDQHSEALIAAISADPGLIDWPMNSSASCYAHMFGAYIGRPADFDVTYRSGGDTLGVQSHTSIVSAGLAITPSAYVSLLVGYTYGRVSFEADERKVELNAHSLSFSIGGNLDFLATLTRS